MMIQAICKNNLCTGCSSCVFVCPKNCITMKSDSEGFLIPLINEGLCISCGKCQRICPVNNVVEDDGTEPLAYAVRNTDSEVRFRSSSGGVFFSFAKKILERNGAVIGAGFDEHFKVCHKVIADIDKLDEILRSKYVQSDISPVYLEVKSLLECGTEVLFCGTPCQVGGIKAYLAKDYPNLYLVDFICHGVPSPAVWEKYLEFRKEKAKSDIESVNFRSKKCGWSNYSMEIGFKNGETYFENVSNDIYFRSYIMDMDLRPSCYECVFKQTHRDSDITLADFWGCSKCDVSFDDDSGVSLVLFHSDKGKRLLELCKNDVEVKNVPFDKAIRSNPSFSKSVRKPPLRDSFMRDAGRLSFDKLHKKYCANNLSGKIRRKIAEIKL